ncbi:MAG TPA: FtsX-like permease family protein, partial [Vicinamibacteria bacterium]
MRKTRILLVLALRNLGRYLRRTLLTAAAMIVGGALLMISLPLGDGTHEAWIESGVRMGSGHVSMQSPEFQTSRKLEDRLSASARADAEAALEDPRAKRLVEAVSPQLLVSGLASSAAGARPASIVGVRPESEAKFGILDDKLVEGRYLQDGDRLSAYVGAGLAESLELTLGSRMVVTAQDAKGEVVAQLARVLGIFRTGVPEIDQSLVHVPLATAGAWLGTGEDVTQIAILVRRSSDADPLRRELLERLAGPVEAGRLAVTGWREAMPELDAAVAIDDFGNYMMQGILFTIIALGIVNTVLMSVLHRHREFGVLQALGLTPIETGSLVLVEGLILTVVSGVLGISLGLSITWFFWRDGLDFSSMWSEEWSISGVILDPIIVPLFRASRVIQGMVFILIVGGLASLYPAFRAARIDVTEAMK